MFDAHIHYFYGKSDSPQEFLQKAASAGISGGNIMSTYPEKNLGCADGDYRWQARIEAILSFTSQTPGFNPFFWINPTDKDYEKQIGYAVEHGIKGFKIICEKYYPEDCIPACKVIAETGKPVMFHSGVLAMGRDVLACPYNRPSNFEVLFAVKNLRFSMAHMGWPWVDDFMAMVAKDCFVHDPEFGNRMYVDLAPGTPGIYREEALRKLYLTGYSVKDRVIWSTDGWANDYNPLLPEYWQKRDTEYMKKIAEDAAVARHPFQKEVPDLSDIFYLATEENWKRFAGMVK